MDRLEKIKKASRLIGKVGKVFQIVSGIFAGIILVSIIILSTLRNTLNTMIAESQTNFDFSSMGYWTGKLFKRFCNDYSPFLPEIVKDLKIISLLAALLILRSSVGLGIVSGFIFWGIIELYEYGCELQNQVDETL